MAKKDKKADKNAKPEKALRLDARGRRASRGDAAARPRLRARKRPPGAERFARQEPRELAVFDPDNVEQVLDAMPTQDVILRASDRLQGLAHPSRVQAMVALSASELCVGDVAAVLGLSLSATSTMLKQMRGLGFVAARHAGKQTYYRMSSAVPKAVLDVLFRLDDA